MGDWAMPGLQGLKVLTPATCCCQGQGTTVWTLRRVPAGATGGGTQGGWQSVAPPGEPGAVGAPGLLWTGASSREGECFPRLPGAAHAPTV